MEEIAKIISAISDVTELTQEKIVSGKSKMCKSAREILCYIALKDRYGLTWKLMELLKWRKSQVFFAVDNCKNKIEEDVDFLQIMNKVRNELNLFEIYTNKLEEMKTLEKKKEKEMKKRYSKDNAKRIFGIDYSSEDEAYMAGVMQASCDYMSDLCAMGIQVNPLLCN